MEDTNKTRQLIREMKQILDKGKKLTVEAYVMSDEAPYEINNPGYDGGKEYFEDGEAPAQGAKQFIDQIRLLSLKGMEAIIDQPESPTFDLLMKMFTLANKAVESKDEDDKSVPAQQQAPAAPAPQA